VYKRQIAACCVLVAGCGTGFIEGTVLDVTGQTLPGVAVEVRGTPYEGLSDAHGRYRVKYQPGELQLYFAKTGYTPGMLVLSVDSMRSVEATSVVLWRLPEGGGVYLYENHRYRRTDFIPPSPFKSMTAEDGIVYGTTRWPKLETTDHDPLILCHKKPSYGCKLYQMNLAELHPPSDDSGDTMVSAWIPGEDIPIVTEPIDAPEGLLVRIRPMHPLETGSYAVHWGALDGVPIDNEQNMFFFSIVDTNTPQASEDETPAETSPESESTSQIEDENDA